MGRAWSAVGLAGLALGRYGLRDALEASARERRSLIDRAFDPTSYDGGGRPRIDLTLTRAVIEQHGGRFVIESEPAKPPTPRFAYH